MSTEFSLKPRLFAFDLDGTLLTSEKELPPATIELLRKCSQQNIKIVFASGRIKSSIEQYTAKCPFPVAILSLNGASVYTDSTGGSEIIYSAMLPSHYADYLIDYTLRENILLNYYYEEQLYAVHNGNNAPWIALYIEQTRSKYTFIPSLQTMKGKAPSKIIFVGDPRILDQQQRIFTEKWGSAVYICRTWDYYLEFLHPEANKGSGLSALADFYAIPPENIVAFGDAMNDIPMLEYAGMSIAVGNAGNDVKRAAKKVSSWNNDEECVARELALLLS